MFIYKIAEGEYEYYHDILLSHDNKYTNEGFKNIVIDAINKVLDEEPDEIDLYSIRDFLIEKYGFKEYKLEIQASIYEDWSILNLVEGIK